MALAERKRTGRDKDSKKLSHRQSILIKKLAKGMTITDAAIEAGYSEKYAGQVGSQALESIRRRMPEVLDRHGLTEDALVKRYLKPALRAHETKFAQKDGIFTDEKEVISWGPRLTALDMAFNLRGSYAPREQAGQTNVQVVVMSGR